MEIVIIDHARQRMLERGASEDEVHDTMLSGTAASAKAGRQAKERVFPYNSDWQGRRHPQKKVRVIYVQEAERLVVITVYAYYGRWEDT